MSTAMTDIQGGEILKGDRFASRVAEICRELPEVRALPDLKYKRILLPGMVGGEYQFALLGFVAHALRMRGAEVTCLLCDEFLPACTMKKADHYESACIRWCYRNSGPFVRAAQLPHRWYGEFISEAEKEDCLRSAGDVPADEIRNYTWRGINLGVHVKRSIESYFKVGRFDPERPEMLAKGREFLASAKCLTLISERVLDELKIDKVFMEDGLKVDWGVMRAVARHRDIPVDVSQGASRGAHILLEHDCSPAPSNSMPLWEDWKKTPLTDTENAELDEYFASRATKPYEDQSWTAAPADLNNAEIRKQIGIPDDIDGFVFAMFPNLSYDAAVTTSKPTYETAAEWVAETIRFFAKWPQHHLIVKIHPAEQYRNVLDPMVDFLEAEFDSLPENVHVLPPETKLTAHNVLNVLDIALIYTSTVGVEAAYFGKPVINVGGGWYSGRGVSTDVNTPQRYFEVLSDICSSCEMPKLCAETAKRLAYSVFFRSILPIHHYSRMNLNNTGIHLSTLEDLRPGRDRTIDIICRGILCDEPFFNS